MDSDRAMAMNRRAWTGMRGLEKPGISIRQAPMRLNTTKAARTPVGENSLKRSCREA